MLIIMVMMVNTIQIDGVTAKQLKAALNTGENIGVFWYSKNCKTCDRVLGVLERVTDGLGETEMVLVRVNDKRAAKTYSIRNFPALSVFKEGDPLHFTGDLTDPDQLLDFLTSSDSSDKPG